MLQEIAETIITNLPGQKIKTLPLEQIWVVDELGLKKFTSLSALQELGKNDRVPKIIFFENHEFRNPTSLTKILGEWFPHTVIIPT